MNRNILREFAIRYGFILLAGLLVLFFGIFANGFAGPRSAVFIFQSVAITGILALGVTCTLVVDGFDLSIGSVATSALMLSAYMMVVLEQNAFIAVVACLLMGAAVGLVNGFLIVKMRVPDLLATLGMMFLLLQYFNISIAWGMQFQQPYFLIFITLIVFLFMMNMFGQFEIILPPQFNNLTVLGNSNNKYLKDFFNGFFATLMATPCSAPFVGTAITAAFTQSYVIGVSIFLFMGIGMSLPYILIASFPKLINFVPKPGKWMVYIKYALGFLLLATVLWLLNILLNFFNYYFIISLIIFFVVLSYRQKIPFLRNIVTVLVLFTIFSSSSLKFFQQNIITNNEKDWLNFFDVEIDQLINNNQLVFLDITADWCATCQFNKLNVLTSESVKKLFKDNKVTLVRADWTRPNTNINIFLEKYDRFGIPFNAFFSNNFPDGFLLSELLSEKEMISAINKINNN